MGVVLAVEAGFTAVVDLEGAALEGAASEEEDLAEGDSEGA